MLKKDWIEQGDDELVNLIINHYQLKPVDIYHEGVRNQQIVILDEEKQIMVVKHIRFLKKMISEIKQVGTKKITQYSLPYQKYIKNKLIYIIK
jgi:hypothetical protein